MFSKTAPTMADIEEGSNSFSSSKSSILTDFDDISVLTKSGTQIERRSGGRILSSTQVGNNSPHKNFKKMRLKSLLWVRSPHEPKKSSTILAQLLPTLILNMAFLSSGMALGFSTILFSQLGPNLDIKSRTNGPKLTSDVINHDVIFSIDTMLAIGAVFGGLISGHIGSRYGSRMCLLVMIWADIAGWILVASSQTLAMLLVGRCLSGIAFASYMTSVQIYVAEISQAFHRGWLSAITMASLALGRVISYSLWPVLDWRYIAIVGCAFPLLLLPGLVYLPKSPYWYLLNNEDKKALGAMKRFRMDRSDSLGELLTISHSMTSLIRNLSLKQAASYTTKRQFRKPFLVVLVLGLLMAVSGISSLSEKAIGLVAAVSPSDSTSAIIIGSLRLLGALLLIPAMRFIPRRVLLCATSLIIAMCLVANLITLHVAYPEGRLIWWVGVCCSTVPLFLDPIGLGSLTYTLMAESFPAEVRSWLCGILVSIIHLAVVATNQVGGGDHAGALTAAIVVYCLAFFASYLLVHETKDETLEEIEIKFTVKESAHVTPLSSPISTTGRGKKARSTPFSNLSVLFTL